MSRTFLFYQPSIFSPQTEPSSIGPGSNQINVVTVISDSDESQPEENGEILEILDSSSDENTKLEVGSKREARCFGGPALKRIKNEKSKKPDLAEELEQKKFDQIKKYTVRDNFAVDDKG